MPLAPSTLDVLAATPSTLRALVGGLPDHVVTMPGPEGWSPRDVVAHLASIQGPALVDRIDAILASDTPDVPNIDEDRALADSGLHDRELREVLMLFEKERASAVERLRSLNADDLERRGRHELAGALSVCDVIHHMAYHDLSHVRQIAALLEHPIEAMRGAMRTAFPA